jgi:non-reducing end alpha-L-arabinofuranosidase
MITGGAPSSGGVTSTGGQTSSSGGGGASTGGATGTGGATATGGATGNGGATGTGGATSAGCATSPGGAGGATSAGGATGSGGVTSGGGSATGGSTSAGGATGAGGSTTPPKGPCDIYKEIDGQPCVAAHSTVRRLLSTYTGPLYQVRAGGSAAGTGGTTTDIGALPDGYANAAAQDTACGSSPCTISIIYDQSGKGKHLTHTLPGGSAKPGADNEADAKALKITVGGHTVYGEHNPAGVGYRNNKAVGLATGDNAETEYMITSGDYFNGGCCFDYGNMETNTHDNGEGTMEAIYFGNCTIWGKGSGSGPWVMGDLENGLWAGNVSPYSGNTPVTYKYVTAFLKGDAAGKNHWAIKAGDAQAGPLKKMFDEVRPNSRYNPMRKEGAIGLGTGGDNSNGANGNFFEGIMTAHYSSDAADDAVQANIVAAGYGK